MCELPRAGENDVREAIRRRADVLGKDACAAQLKVSRKHLNDLIIGRKPVSEEVAFLMGYERRVVFLYRGRPVASD